VTKFNLSKKSLKNLEYVHEDLCLVVNRAIELTDTDFMVFEGYRSVTRQKALVKAGASHTMNSRHLSGHAVDLVPVLTGMPRWDWPLCYRVAEAMKLAALEYSIPIVWGGVWDRILNGFEKSCEDEVMDYVARRRNLGDRAFIDGPHFELPRENYP
jgi:peptidoglycan L-alanyl-D-glutamate endopeptidase CwlK